jgi:hypothetical protein
VRNLCRIQALRVRRLSKQNSKEALDEGSRGPRLLSLPEWAQAGSRFSAGRVTRISSFNLVLQIANAAFFAVSLERACNLRCSFSGVGVTVAVQGDGRFSDAHASQHCDIYHNSGSRFGRDADSAETRRLI